MEEVKENDVLLCNTEEEENGAVDNRVLNVSFDVQKMSRIMNNVLAQCKF